jgi:SAM-dependent methyltransferase
MKLELWLLENESLVDWNIFSSPWDAMQLKHNPFRKEQIEVIINSSGILENESPIVLDLGCGPGILGKLLINENPKTQYYGADGDPLMLSAMKHNLQSKHVHALQLDLRKTEWGHAYTGHFDSVISLTALHWLSQEHLNKLYRAVYNVLKPGGIFVVGDPYKPEDNNERDQLEALHNELASKQSGQTWDEIWQEFFAKYPIKEMYTEYHKQTGYQIPFEGSDDGYTLSSHIKALRRIGFTAVSVFWKADLRSVYGGKREFPKA